MDLAEKTDRLMETLSSNNPHLRSAMDTQGDDEEMKALENILVERFRAGLNQSTQTE
jgi:hypothetical protein